MTPDLDVAILGGGLAGNLLARQLMRADARLRVAVFEKQTERSYKVGESTVEIATNYLTRRLGLASYCYDQHLPKNGLRFFCDTVGRDASLTEMSEIGSAGLPYHPSFQLDRARLEADLLEMNASDGVEVRVGAKVETLSLNADGDHELRVAQGETKETRRARWVIDATGRASMVAKQKGLRRELDGHELSAAWVRARGVADLDALDAPEWHARVRHTSRVLSTNHFCYRGYWIWLIPLRNGITSIGVVSERDHFDPAVRRRDGFLPFLRGHESIAPLFENAELIDHGTYKQLAYGTKRFFEPSERWAVIGDAAAFTDPFYSPGSDFIAIENDLVTDLIMRDRAGDDRDEYRRRGAYYEELMQFRFEATMLLYEDLYSTFGSFDLLQLKWDFDIACYYNLWFDSYLRDEHLDLDGVRRMLGGRAETLTCLRNFADMFRALRDTLDERGEYHRSNVGMATTDLRLDFEKELGSGKPKRHKRSHAIFERTREDAMKILEAIGHAPAHAKRMRFPEYLERRPLL